MSACAFGLGSEEEAGPQARSLDCRQLVGKSLRGSTVGSAEKQTG